MTFIEYLLERWPELTELTLLHAQVVLIAIGVATVISVPVGVAVHGRDRASRIVLSITGAALTIPSFALFGLLIPIFGLGVLPTIAALVLYAIFPILRNTVTGLESVDPAMIDAGQGMGLSPGQRLRLVRLPLAWPVVLTGIRVSTIMVVAIAAIAAAVHGPGLGKLIFGGLARMGGANALNDVLAGVVGVIIIALVLDIAFLVLARLTTSRGVRV
ncbi:MAG: ABC transporter permease subunit [Micromonosporaceae bacterium]|nr:ABC transporter permease subunit [Micromonosporaceae bacterium]